jgi:hydroxyacylglutathione hydrolase
MKKAVVVVLGLLVLAIVPIVGLGAVTFGGLAPLRDESLGTLGEVVKDGHVSIGVVDVGDDALVLVDAGKDSDGETLLAAVDRRGAKPEDVVAIFLTHGHPDHLAGVGRFPKAKVHVLAAEVPYLTGETPYLGPLPGWMGVEEPGVRLVELADGDLVRVGRRTIDVFAVPGHTAGSAAYLVDDVLFVGDSASLEADGAVRSGPWLFSDDVEKQSASLRALAKRLKGRTVRKVVFGHTGSSDGKAALEAF